MDDHGDLIQTLRLYLIEGIGPRLIQNLVSEFSTVENIFTASQRELTAIPGIGKTLAARIFHSCDSEATKTIALCQENDIEIITSDSKHYSSLLSETFTPPIILFRQGIRSPQTRNIAVVGTRRCSPYGRRTAIQLSQQLSKHGYTIVSGLAYGIDEAAHTAALNAGGETIAVLGSGLLRIYPQQHQALAHRVSQQGSLISEFPPHAGPRKAHFPQRNRIISGLCAATIVVQAAQRSGALITANLALEQGRDVFAVPGPINDYRSRGCHQLIRDGAHLVESADDILDVLEDSLPAPLSAGERQVQQPAVDLSESESRILALVEETPTSVDYLIQSCDSPAASVLPILTQLEMKRLIVRTSSQFVSRA